MLSRRSLPVRGLRLRRRRPPRQLMATTMPLAVLVSRQLVAGSLDSEAALREALPYRVTAVFVFPTPDRRGNSTRLFVAEEEHVKVHVSLDSIRIPSVNVNVGGNGMMEIFSDCVSVSIRMGVAALVLSGLL